jgi:signal transduction histidine kinase
MRRGSIALRLFWFSLIWLIVALAFTAILLTNLYSRALDNSLQETLEFHLETLVGVSVASGGDAFSSSGLADPRFSRPASGWYWEVRNAQGNVISFSPSLIGTVLPQLEGDFDDDTMRTGVQTDGFGTQIRMIESRVTLDDTQLFITVTGNLDEIFELVANFRGQTMIVLGAVGAMLAIMSAIVARFALRPIGRLRQALEDVREGEKQSVEGVYPQEIAPLANEINELLQSNTRIIERARSQVGNLAHGLKTPIAVLRNEADNEKTPFSEVVGEQTEKMSELVARYLDRAQLSARTALVGRKADAGEVLTRLARVMKKLHPDREVTCEVSADGSFWFRGEESDLEEMVGNLLENACKWSKARVLLTVAETAIDNNRVLRISIEDDGKGLSEKDATKVLQRGVRLDEKAPGSGLGLDIVTELAEVYGGSLNLSKSALGGLCAQLILPAAGGVRPNLVKR